MLIVLLIASFVINIAVILILFQIICYGTKKYIKERIERDLKLLDKLQEIGKDIDNETDRLKIMIYDKYLDRCIESLRKKREMDNEYREMTRKVKEKCQKNEIKKGTFGRFFWAVGLASPDLCKFFMKFHRDVVSE